MSDRLPLWRSPWGVSSDIDFDDNSGTFSVVTSYTDEQPLLDENARKRNAGRQFYASDPDNWKVASVPISVQFEWLNKYGVQLWREGDWPKVRKLLNSPDYRYLKTAEIII